MAYRRSPEEPKTQIVSRRKGFRIGSSGPNTLTPHISYPMLLSIANLKKAYGPDEILTGVTFRLAAREKVALVGRNGTGKTTLLKIITGRLELDTGSVQLAQGAKVG